MPGDRAVGSGLHLGGITLTNRGAPGWWAVRRGAQKTALAGPGAGGGAGKTAMKGVTGMQAGGRPGWGRDSEPALSKHCGSGRWRRMGTDPARCPILTR